MQRRQPHPHAQLTGMIVLISLMLSVGVMFWVPNATTPQSAVAAGTPTLPLAITRTPRPDLNAPAAQSEPPTPTMDWSTVPTPVPADQLLAEALAQTAAAIPPPIAAAPQIIYRDTGVSPADVLAAQQAQAAAEANAQYLADQMKAQADAAFEQQRRDEARLATAQATQYDPAAFGQKQAPDRAAEYAAATAQP